MKYPTIDIETRKLKTVERIKKIPISVGNISIALKLMIEFKMLT